MKKTFYVTTPIYYVNAKPHIGTLYSTLIADVITRYQQLLGNQTYFLTGTDEHGQKIEQVAAAQKTSPQAFVDSMIEPFKKMWQLYGIDYSHFIRTTDPKHISFVTNVITKLLEKGEIYKSTYSGLYCTPCETFVTHNIDEIDNSKPQNCPTCGRSVQPVSEESYFFRLSAYQDRLLQFYEEHPEFICPKERASEISSFVKNGLKDLCISRASVAWGIPFPGDQSQTIYVWVDALMNYLSGADELIWPADVQVMAKDIVRFHAVYLPAFLMALDKPLPKKLLVHGYILSGDAKMSKSLGNSIDPEALAQTYGTEAVRYYLLKQMSIGHDGNFSIPELITITNADLSNSLGNLLNRTLALAHSAELSTVKAPDLFEAKAIALRLNLQKTMSEYVDAMSHYQFHKALSATMELVAQTNAYLHAMEPWKLKGSHPELFAEIISATLHALDSIAVMLHPFMPQKMNTLLVLLGKEAVANETNLFETRRNAPWNQIFTLQKSEAPLFPRFEVEAIQKAAAQEPVIVEQELITIDQFVKMKIAVGTITACIPVAKSEKLLQLTVDLGSFGIRTILSGVAQSFTPDQLINTQGLFVVNLPERKMAGIVSQGMMLFATKPDGKLTQATTKELVENGKCIG